jgi:hypothetical protein
MRNLAIVLIILLTTQTAGASDIFYWKWQLVNGQIKVSGKLNNEKESYTIVEGNAIIERFAFLYKLIDEKIHSKLSLFSTTVDTLSKQLVKPFITEIRKSTLVVLNIDSTLLFFPIEVLKVDTYYLALYRPMVFQASNSIINPDTDTLTIYKGFILRDPTADLADNSQYVLSKYPGSELKSMSNLDKEDLNQNHYADFFFMSAHGIVDSSLHGGILVDETNSVSSDFVKKNNPRLFYTDACYQGINLNYITALAATKETNYYVGSIVTVDLADASIHNIERFFTFLSQTHDPVISLWKTKQRVFKNYNQPSLAGINQTILTVINKSLMFRVYKI